MTGITVDRDDVVRLACDLIAIESHKDAPGREAPVGRFLLEWFRQRGVDAELVPAVGDRANVIARVPLGDGSGPTVLLNGHIDTVAAGAMQNAFSPRIEDGVLWGRGACDMKAAVAAMACVLAATARELAGTRLPTPGSGAATVSVLAATARGVGRSADRLGRSRAPQPDEQSATGPSSGGSSSSDGLGPLRDERFATARTQEFRPLSGTLLFAGTVDEETGSLGVKGLVESGIKADCAVVGEPTCLKPTIAHKGACFLRIVVTGRGAHGSCPEKGVSATSYGARIVTALEDELRPRLAKRVYPLLGASTVSVGRMCGGTEPNIVAERCEIDVDRRTLPGEADIVGEVQGVVAAICDGVAGLSYEVHETERTSVVPHVALGTPPDSRLARAAAVACGALGLPSDPVGVTYWTDGAHLAASGIETIILGPGDIADAHGPNDRVRIDDVVRSAEIYARIAGELLGCRPLSR